MKTKASELIESPEILAAVEWWSHQLLGHALHDAGDPLINGFSNLCANRLGKAAAYQVDRFRDSLKALLAVHCAETWDATEPRRGSALRATGCDYGPDLVLRAALDYSMITEGHLRLPIKTMMWINPGEVRVRPGYHGEEVVLYQKQGEPVEEPSPSAKAFLESWKRTTRQNLGDPRLGVSCDTEEENMERLKAKLKARTSRPPEEDREWPEGDTDRQRILAAMTFCEELPTDWLERNKARYLKGWEDLKDAQGEVEFLYVQAK